jgi:hypothetical protein
MMKKLILSGLVSVLLMGDYTISYQFDEGDGVSVVDMMQYKDDKNIKLSYYYENETNKLPKRGLYVIDSIKYSVEGEDNNLTYHGVTQYGETEDEAQPPKKPFFKVIKKLDKEYIAGFEGEIWVVESNEDGIKEQEKIVVCSNKDLVSAVKSYFSTIKDFGEGAYGQEYDEEFESMFMVADGYVLIAARGIELQHFEKKPIPQSVFSLPKEATKIVEVFDDGYDEDEEDEEV